MVQGCRLSPTQSNNQKHTITNHHHHNWIETIENLKPHANDLFFFLHAGRDQGQKINQIH